MEIEGSLLKAENLFADFVSQTKEVLGVCKSCREVPNWLH